MSKYELSVLMPAIRTDRWVGMYESIAASFSGSWELVIITSKELPDELKDKDNIKMIYSRRAPMQKQQEGLCQVEGEYVTPVSDDSVFLPGTLDKTFELVRTLNYKTLVILKYLEGKEFDFPAWYIEQVPEDMRFKTNYDFMRADKYYWSDTHDSSTLPNIPKHSPILSCSIISTKLLKEVGGWDCRFQSAAMGNIDLSARLMIYGCKYIIQDLVASKCGFMAQSTGDHGPIHYAQLEDDQPLLNALYTNNPNQLERVKIDINNWKLAPEVWERAKDVN